MGHFELREVLWGPEPSSEIRCSIEKRVEGQGESNVGQEVEADKLQQLTKALLKDNLKLPSPLSQAALSNRGGKMDMDDMIIQLHVIHTNECSDPPFASQLCGMALRPQPRRMRGQHQLEGSPG